MEGLYQVNILGRLRDIYFGLPAIEYISEKVDFKVFGSASTGSLSSSNFKTIVYFVYAGLAGGCDRKDESPDFKYEDVYQEVERLLSEGGAQHVSETVGKAFSASTFFKSKPSKKKEEQQQSTGTKSSSKRQK